MLSLDGFTSALFYLLASEKKNSPTEFLGIFLTSTEIKRQFISLNVRKVLYYLL